MGAGGKSMRNPDVDLVKFLRSKVKKGQKVKINLDKLLGIGGESIAIRKNYGLFAAEKAIKIIPLDGAKVQNQVTPSPPYTGGISSRLPAIFRSEKSNQKTIKAIENLTEKSTPLTGRSEYDCSSIQHKNLIKYENVSMDLVDNGPVLIAGN